MTFTFTFISGSVMEVKSAIRLQGTRWEREPCPWAAGLSKGKPYLQERSSGHGGRAGIEVKASPGKAQTFPAEHLRVWRKDLKEWWTKNEKQIRSIKLK